MRILSILLTGFVLVVPLVVPLGAQNPALKNELHAKETAAKQDPEALFQVAKWAEEKGLAADAKRLYQSVVKINPDHEGANTALGNVNVDGKWIPGKDSEAARKKAMEAEYKAKGMVEVTGVWVEKEEVADAKHGVFHHGGERVTKEEKLALLGGSVRHPVTRQLIDAKDLDKARDNQFPIGTENRWVDEKEADEFHADTARPWMLRSEFCTVIGSLPVKKMQEVALEADNGYKAVRDGFFKSDPTPANRPAILAAGTLDQFKEFGHTFGDEYSSHEAFMATERGLVKVPFQGQVRPAICYWDKERGMYVAREAAGFAYVHGLAADAGAEVPRWFQYGIAAFAGRFTNNYLAGFFGQQLQGKGGVMEIKSFISAFGINGEMEPSDIFKNVYQAGLLASFAARGGDAKVTEALQEVTAAFAAAKGRNVDKGIDKLHKQLLGKDSEVKAHLQKLIANMNK